MASRLASDQSSGSEACLKMMFGAPKKDTSSKAVATTQTACSIRQIITYTLKRISEHECKSASVPRVYRFQRTHQGATKILIMSPHLPSCPKPGFPSSVVFSYRIVSQPYLSSQMDRWLLWQGGTPIQDYSFSRYPYIANPLCRATPIQRTLYTESPTQGYPIGSPLYGIHLYKETLA